MAFTFVTTQTQIVRTAGALFGIKVGTTDMTSYVAQATAAVSVDAFLNSVYVASIGTTSTATVAAAILANLGIPASTVAGSAGKVAQDYVVTQLNAALPAVRGATVNQILKDFSNLTADATFGTFATTFNTKVAAAQTYATIAGNAQVDFSSSTTVVATPFTLTTGIDAITGTAGSDTINAPLSAGVESFTSLDNIDGGADIDTLNIISLGALTTAVGAIVTGVEIVNLTATAAITAADISGFTGVNTLNVVSTGAIAGVAASATTDINVAKGLGAVTVQGGKDIVIKAAGSVSVGSTTAAAGNVTTTTTTAADTTTIKGAGVLTANSNDGTIGFTNGTSVTANATKAVALADVTAHTAALTALIVVAAADASTGTAKTADTTAGTKATALVTFAGKYTAANIDSDTVAEHKALTLAELAAGRITLANKVAIDAAYVTAFTAVGGTATLAQAAALALIAPINAAAAAAKVITAATLVTAAAATTAATVITVADTTAAGLVNGVVITATTNTALTSATINGNYGSTGNAVTDGSTLSNTLTTLTLNNAGATTVTGLAIANVSATGMVADVTVLNTTATHTQTFALSGVTAGTYTDSNATTVNVVSNGTATNVLTGLSAILATKVNLTGTAGLTFGATTFAAAAVIDASGNSGSNKITTQATQTYTGGSGVDTVTSSNGVAQSKAIDGGAGETDKLILGSTVDFGTTAAAALFKNFETLQSTVTVDVSKFTGSAISKVMFSGTISVTGLTAAQAANVVINAASTPTIGVTGAATPGQLDIVNIDVNDASATVNTFVLTAPVLAGVETLNLTATDNFSIDLLTSAPALTKVTVSGAGTSSITTGVFALAANTVIDASAATGTVVISALGSTGNGLAIIGSATKANTLTGNALASVLTGGAGNDTITGGAGNDTISGGEGNNTLAGNAGANTITAGNGNNTVSVTGSTSANSITVGNGYNTITGGTGDDTIIVGTGGNVITSGAGLDKITLGAHVLGATNTLVFGSTAEAATVANVDTITGFVSGTDTVQLTSGVTGTGSLTGLTLAAGNTAATMLAAVTDATSVATLADVYTALATATGLNNSAGHVFAASAAGTATLVARQVVYTTGAAAGTYLVINDATDGFQAANDIVIKLVGNTTFAAGDITVVAAIV